MTLKFHPEIGTIVLCDYRSGFQPPEMSKRRPVVIVSPRLRRREDLCSVVPLSQTPPNHPQDYHYQLILDRPLPAPWNSPIQWVKADMIATIAFKRLHLIGIGRDQEGKRKYLNKAIPIDDLNNIRKCVLNSLGLSFLTHNL